MESKTPRTDAETIDNKFFDPERPYEWVALDFAKQLETELAEARAEIELKNRLIEQMREALKAMLRYPMLPIELDEIAEAALAAEGGK